MHQIIVGLNISLGGGFNVMEYAEILFFKYSHSVSL